MEEHKVTEEQQDLYDIFVAQGIKLAQQVGPTIENPSIKTLSDVLVGIVDKIESDGKNNGVQFDSAVLLHGSGEILTSLASAAGMEIDETQVREIAGRAAGKYLDKGVKSGKIDKETLVKLGQQAENKGEAKLFGGMNDGAV